MVITIRYSLQKSLCLELLSDDKVELASAILH